MTGMAFDTFTQQLGRRRALQALGAAAVATASGLTLASAKNGNNGNKKKRATLQQRIEKKSLALCASQVPECVTLITANCGDNAECLAAGEICCQSLGTCEFAEFFTCASPA